MFQITFSFPFVLNLCWCNGEGVWNRLSREQTQKENIGFVFLYTIAERDGFTFTYQFNSCTVLCVISGNGDSKHCKYSFGILKDDFPFMTKYSLLIYYFQ